MLLSSIFLFTYSFSDDDCSSIFRSKFNNAGKVLGYSRVSSGETHAFLWTTIEGMTDLGTLGGTYSKARDINDAEQVVGYSETSSGYLHAFLSLFTHKLRVLDDFSRIKLYRIEKLLLIGFS